MPDEVQPTKPYDLTLEPRDGYLYAFVAGQHDNFDISYGYWKEIGQRLGELGMKKVLIVEDIVEQAPMADIFQLMTKLADIGFRGVRIAFVDRYLSHGELNDFGALVAHNRGLQGQAFASEPEAESWLLA